MGQGSKGLRWQGLSLTQHLVVAAFLLSAIFYFQWRLGSFNPQAPIFSALLFAAEAYGFLSALLHVFTTLRLTERSSPDVPEGLSVDVFIAVDDEPTERVRRTALAALEMEYPHRVWLLDETGRTQIAAMAAELGCRYSGPAEHPGKAGSLNKALLNSDAEYIAVFDADHAPARGFLSETLGYLGDAEVAFVQTPLDFFNLDSYQHRRTRTASIWTEQSLFFRVIQRGKDYWNAALFCGSCAVIRRAALDRVGGFATGTVAEDLHTSIRLHKAGYRSVYHARSLAFGVAPSTIASFLKQRIRSGQGAMQVWRHEGVLFSGKLTLPQRLNYLASILSYFEGWQKGFFYLAPIVVLVTGLMPITGLDREFVLRFVCYLVLTFWVFEEVGRGFGRATMIEQYNFARFWAFAWATLALFTREVKPDRNRSAAIPQDRHYVIPQLGILGLSLLAMPIGLVLCFVYQKLPLEGLIAGLLWAAVNIVLAVATLLFTRNSSRARRHDYRFPIPLPVWVRVGGVETGHVPAHVLGTVDDISSSGCRIYAPLPADLGRDTMLEGKIFLPSGAIPFNGTVASLITVKAERGAEPGYVKSIGCRFEWNSSLARDRLDLFLYGSDLQWQLLALTERISTPLESFSDFIHGRRPQTAFEARLWTPVVYHANGLGGGPTVALVSRDTLLAFARLPDMREIDVTVVSRTRTVRQRRSVSAVKVLQSPLSLLYQYRSVVMREAVTSSPAQATLNAAANKAPAEPDPTPLKAVVSMPGGRSA